MCSASYTFVKLNRNIFCIDRVTSSNDEQTPKISQKVSTIKEYKREKWKEQLSNSCWHVIFSINDKDMDLMATQFNRIVRLQ